MLVVRTSQLRTTKSGCDMPEGFSLCALKGKTSDVMLMKFSGLTGRRDWMPNMTNI